MTDPIPERPGDSFIGRAESLEGASALLTGGARLLTLTGPGGVGKTRLGLELVRVVAKHYPDGVWFVDLADLHAAEMLLGAVARAIGLRDAQRSATELLEHYLGSRCALLVLDNLEHLSGAAQAVGRLLSMGPRVQIVATSRWPLRLHGEQRFPVRPLEYPAAPEADAGGALESYPAVALFVARARAVAPDFALSAENALAVTRLCAHLDGLPLALELVAARADVLGPQAMLERLERGQPLPMTGAADAPARHRSLEAAVGWSYTLLNLDQQHLLRQLAIFEGGWTLEAAGAVVGAKTFGVDPLERVVSLVERSLVRTVSARAEPRFAMLATIRAFALDRLAEAGEQEAVARRHAEYFLGLAGPAERELIGPNQVAWLERLDLELENLRAALRWARAAAPLRGLRLAASLRRFWDARGYRSEGRDWIGTLIAEASRAALEARDGVADDATLADATVALGALALAQGDYPEAGVQLERGLTLWRSLGRAAGEAEALALLGTVAYTQFDRERARALYAQALEMDRREGDRHGTADLLVRIGMLERDEGDLERAEATVEDGLRLHHETGDLAGIAGALLRLGSLAADRGDLARGARLFEEARGRFAALGHGQGEAAALVGQGEAARQAGDLGRAAALWAESLRVFHRIGQPYGASWCLEALAEVAAVAGLADDAARLFGAGAALRESIGVPPDPDDAQSRAEHLDLARAALGVAAFETALFEGRRLRLEDAVHLALRMASSLPDAQSEPEAAAPPALSARETEVLGLVARGFSNKEIASELAVTDHTVKFHLRSAFGKLGCRTRAEAVRVAASLGLIGASGRA